MSIDSSITSSAQFKSAPHRHFISPNFSISTAIITFASAALIIASATIGATFAFNLAGPHGWHLAIVFAMAALGADLIKPFVIALAYESARTWKPAVTALCLAIGTVLVAYSLIASLGFSAAMRSDLAAERKASSGITQRLNSRLQAIEIESALLPSTPPSATVSAQINRLRSTPGAACDALGTSAYGRISKRVCPQIAELQVALATSRSREKLQSEMASISARLDTAPAAKVADPLTSVLIAVAATFGMTLHASSVAAWASVMFPIVVEVGSSCGLLVAKMQQSSRETLAGTQKVTRLETPAETLAVSEVTPVFSAVTPDLPIEVTPTVTPTVTPASNTDDDDDEPAPPATSVPAVASAKKKILELVASNGGQVRSAQRAIADQINVVLKNCNIAIHELAEEGRLIVNTSNRGTTLRLATI